MLCLAAYWRIFNRFTTCASLYLDRVTEGAPEQPRFCAPAGIELDQMRLLYNNRSLWDHQTLEVLSLLARSVDLTAFAQQCNVEKEATVHLAQGFASAAFGKTPKRCVLRHSQLHQSV